MGSILHGADVSKYDGNVDWAQAKAAGIAFAFARVSDGTANPDAYFAANWQGMQKSGIVRGAYQYFRAGADPSAQAALIASSLTSAGGLLAGDLPVVMDIETADGQAEATIEANMRTWLAAVQAHTGRTPIIYTSTGTFPIAMTAFAAYPLWVANYGATCPSMPTGWSSWEFWQYSATGTVNGIGSGNVDLDEFNGTLADLVAIGGHPASDGGSPEAEAGALEPQDGGASSGDAAFQVDSGAPLEVTGDGGSAMGKAGLAAPPPPSSNVDAGARNECMP